MRVRLLIHRQWILLVPLFLCYTFSVFCVDYSTLCQGAIMAVGASKPTVVTDADGFFSVKSKMLVSSVSSNILSRCCLHLL